ncbi:MAG: hypothetical protein HN522_05440 [Flavobacteriales bacterium]|jgi:hypothetical protein|nr:hypothetical protein [Flavobacteriales bacterium]MBT5089526.1 hypothetical protein [Flavobacteriales bacterium]MBT5750003.1 hypothetical protein [Flavobacteriales bacterium]
MNLQETTLVFKLGEDNNLSDLKITSEIKHFIADLRGVTPDLAENIKDKFIIFANSISKMNGSFVIVCEFSFEEELTIVPTLQEAYDYIEINEIERQLEL